MLNGYGQNHVQSRRLSVSHMNAMQSRGKVTLNIANTAALPQTLGLEGVVREQGGNVGIKLNALKYYSYLPVASSGKSCLLF
jgi:hypothetical protein